MAYIDNSETKKELNDAIRGNAVSNLAPSQVNNSIQPVINVNPKDYRRCNVVSRQALLNATSATVYTTPSNKDFYLCSISISYIKDATATSTQVYATTIINGATVNLLELRGLTLTASSDSLSITFSTPILIDKGSPIVLNSNTNVANISAVCNITGYTVEL